MQLISFSFISCFMWGKHDVLLYFTVSPGSCPPLLSLYRTFSLRFFFFFWCLRNTKLLRTQSICFPTWSHRLLVAFVCASVQCSKKHFNSWEKSSSPSPSQVFFLSIVILPVCKLSTWAFRGTHETRGEKKMGWKQKVEEKFRRKPKDCAG